MGRTHDFHCRNCHGWVNGFLVMDEEDRAERDAPVCCGYPDLFYDLNHEAECCDALD